MTTPTGTITMLDVILELDGVATPREITLNDADVRGLADVPAGEISMDDLRGKSSQQVVVRGFMTVAERFAAADLFYGAGTFFGTLRDVEYGTVDIGTATLSYIDSAWPFEAANGQTAQVNFVDADIPFADSVNVLTLKGHGPDRVTDLPTKDDNVGTGQVSARRFIPPTQLLSSADVGLEFEFIVTDS